VEHGVFHQWPSHHRRGIGCPVCGSERTVQAKTKETNDFIEDAKEIHGDRYDYSRVRYSTSHVKVEIICPNHGRFSQTPASHLFGRGCPTCNASHGEKAVADVLDLLGIRYERQKTFPDCLMRNKLRFDFYLPDFNTVIEFDGIQHREPRGFGGDKEKANKEFLATKKRDAIKDAYCKKRGLTTLRVNFICKDTIEERIRDVLFEKSVVTSETLGDDTDETVLRRLGPKDIAALL
jgi:very-short-patch-repair endonuclease